MYRYAKISDDKLYRYELIRYWGGGKPNIDRCLPWIMLNPSTADAYQDDPTISRCITYANDWGYPGIYIINLYAFRATDPIDMMKAPDPIGGEKNKKLLRRVIKRWRGRTIMAAWGNHGGQYGLKYLANNKLHLSCLKLNKSGHPVHPLYQPRELKPRLIRDL